jgi:REP element-mobilizing transposase RayT
MAYHPRIETSAYVNLITIRTMNSALWFVHNQVLHDTILGYLAAYAARYNVVLYGFVITGNHIHLIAHFPLPNRAAFMRDFASSIAGAVRRLVPEFSGGKLWERRYSNEFLPDADDIENEFLYVALQPVQDGLVERISQYLGYNSFSDAVRGIERTVHTIDWKRYYRALEKNPAARPSQFQIPHTLRYSRLPGKESLSHRDYVRHCHKKLEENRQLTLEKRKHNGLCGFLGREALLATTPGATPRSTKLSTRSSHRPRVLSVCPLRRQGTLAWYWNLYHLYKNVAARYRAGDLSIQFPPGMYPPHRWCAEGAPAPAT